MCIFNIVNIKDLIEKLEEEFDEVEPGFIKPETKFTDIENWGSMHALIIIALIDMEYDVNLTGQDLKVMKTVQDLFRIINERA
jgi:acyl carrier protein